MKPRFTKLRNGASGGTRAVERAITVLHAVGDAPGDLGLTELADTIGLHKATAFRLLGALERAGFVTHDVDRQRYRLGPSLITLGAKARRGVGLHDAARPELQKLALETGETATLEVLAGDQVLILDEVHGRFLVGSTPEVGTRWPAYATSTGKMLLAARRYEGNLGANRTPVVAGRLTRLGPNTITSRLALERELALVWRRGYAVGLEEIEPQFVAISAPVRDSSERVVAAISVGGPKRRLGGARISSLAARICEAGRLISLNLGASDRLVGDPTERRPLRTSLRGAARPSLTRPVA